MLINHNHKETNISLSINSILTNKLFWIFSFSILMAIAAQVSIPTKPVPFTLQTMMVVLAGAFLGSKNGAYSQLLYLFLGIIGLPVFADGSMGIGKILGPTGGYLLAFPIGAFLTGLIVERTNKYLLVVLGMFIGEIFVILFGTLYLNLFFMKNFSEALKVGAAIFSVWSVVKVFIAATIYSSFNKISERKNKIEI